MPELPFNESKLLTMLSGSLQFINTYKKDSLPSILSTRNLAPYSFTKKYANKLPYNVSSIDQQASLALAAYKSYLITNDVNWLTLAENVTTALLNYFFVEDVPNPLISRWFHHHLVIAYGSVATEGDQTESNPFNYGKFDTLVSFSNGIGTIPDGSNLSRVFKVYPDNAYLLFENVYAALADNQTDFDIEYYVITLEGSNYKVSNGSLTPTTETAGTIKLLADLNGQAKVTWSDFIGTVASPTTPLSGQGLIESYPIFFDANKGAFYHLASSFKGFYKCHELFLRAFNITGDTKYQRASDCVKYTLLKNLAIDNTSYFYKKDSNINPFSYPGTYIQVNNTREFTGVTATRETLATLQNFLKISSVAESNRVIEIINNIAQVWLTNKSKIILEVASDSVSVLEVNLQLSKDFTDTNQGYTARYLLSNASSLESVEFTIKDFIRWSAGTLFNYQNSVISSVTDDGLVTISDIQTTVNGSKQIVKRFEFDKGLTGTAIAQLSMSYPLSALPKIVYALTGELSILIKDSTNAVFTALLPSTDGNFTTLQLSWELFDGVGVDITDLSFEVIQGTATLDVFYLGADPIYMNPGTVYKASIADKDPTEHTLWIGAFKADSNALETIPYPGCVPSTMQVLKSGSSISNKHYQQGVFYVSDQAPHSLLLMNDASNATNQINFLYDALIDYRNKTNINGILTPSFIPALWESASFTSYGNQFNVFSFQDSDFYNICLAVESVARYLKSKKSDSKAKTIVSSFLSFIDNFYKTRVSIQPPTEIKETGIEVNYHNPAIAAVIGRIAINANLAGIDSKLTAEIIKNSYDYIDLNYVESGLMLGSWSINQNNSVIDANTYKEYPSYYHFDCINFLSDLYLNKGVLKLGYFEGVAIFPEIVPEFIDNFKFPEYKNSTLKFTDNEQTIILNDKPVNAEITLKYNQISESRLQTLLSFWQRQGGKSSWFLLPDVIWKHPDLVTNAVNFHLSQWVFADKLPFNVRVASKDRGLWNLEIKLKQVLAQSYNFIEDQNFDLNPAPEDLDIAIETEYNFPFGEPCTAYDIDLLVFHFDGRVSLFTFRLFGQLLGVGIGDEGRYIYFIAQGGRDSVNTAISCLLAPVECIVIGSTEPDYESLEILDIRQV
jgi:hypothetical protein